MGFEESIGQYKSLGGCFGQWLKVQEVYEHFSLVYKRTLVTRRITGKKIISRSIF